MLKRKIKEKKQEKGITLIALVINIIVLLILAGVTINALSGENGILKKAAEAKQKTEEAQKEEALALKEIEVVMTGHLKPWSGQIATGFASGGGQTEKDPYIIENAEQLAYFASQVNAGETYEGKFIKITKSINLGNKEFTPIGIGSTGTREATEWNMTEHCFNGTLNGNGNVITGVKITKTNMHGVGIIGILGEKGVVENLNTYEGTIIGKTCVGGIVGASKGKIINCTNKLTIIAQDDETSNSGQMAGGIVGWATKGSIEDCKNYGNVTTKDDSVLTGKGKFAGGIVGYVLLEDEITISNCTNSGTVLAVYQQAGGIVGSKAYGGIALTIENCTNSGAVSTGDSEGVLNNGLVGGIIGWAYSETNITSCTNSGAITAVNR